MNAGRRMEKSGNRSPIDNDGQRAKCGGKRLISACRRSFRLLPAAGRSGFSLPQEE
jgi:hypothetical protein